MKIKLKKIIDISLQDSIENIKKVAIYNAKNNYEYILVDDNNLIRYDTLAYLLKIGYKLNAYADNVELRHEKYNALNEILDLDKESE